ncbi:MAG TPA: alpha/beta fold hydrolase, partial [Burkholderiales bacterium]|nr:alpha/beta fold hydrolase [Burkholderiales bacterium]
MARRARPPSHRSHRRAGRRAPALCRARQRNAARDAARKRQHAPGPRSQAALLRALLSRLGVERPVLFGHSFGALVALAFALAFPADTRGVVLASGYYFPTARIDVPFMASPAIPLLGDLMRHTVSPLIARASWPHRLKLLFSPAPVPRYFEIFPTWMALRPSQ